MTVAATLLPGNYKLNDNLHVYATIYTHTTNHVESSKSGLTNARVSRKHPAQTEAAVVGDSGVNKNIDTLKITKCTKSRLMAKSLAIKGYNVAG